MGVFKRPDSRTGGSISRRTKAARADADPHRRHRRAAGGCQAARRRRPISGACSRSPSSRSSGCRTARRWSASRAYAETYARDVIALRRGARARAGDAEAAAAVLRPGAAVEDRRRPRPRLHGRPDGRRRRPADGQPGSRSAQGHAARCGREVPDGLADRRPEAAEGAAHQAAAALAGRRAAAARGLRGCPGPGDHHPRASTP